MVQLAQALSAEGVTAVDQDTRYLLAYSEFFTAVIAKVQTTRLVVTLNDIGHGCFTSLLFNQITFLLVDSPDFINSLHLLIIN